MKTCPTMKPKGFSLIELMIGVAILAILAGVALPSVVEMINNTQTRNAAESVKEGLVKAKGKASSLGKSVTFVLAPDNSWTVSVINPASVIETRPSNQDSISVTRDVLPVGATTITFNSFGTVGFTYPSPKNQDNTDPITQIEFKSPKGSKVLRVEITGGLIKMCDPLMTSGSSPRAC